MQHPLAQLIALTCHGGAFLSGKAIPEFWPGNSTCIFCECVRFRALGRAVRGESNLRSAGETPDQWFAWLKQRGIAALKLGRRKLKGPYPEHVQAAFAGGGSEWVIHAPIKGGKSEPWSAHWELGDREAADRRIWRVTYGKLAPRPFSTESDPRAAFDRTWSEFERALERINAFALEHVGGGFVNCFDSALQTLSSGKKAKTHLTGLAPEGWLDRRALLLLNACQSAWVFGGMGSWNDMGFGGDVQDEYLAVTSALWDALNDAIETATRCIA